LGWAYPAATVAHRHLPRPEHVVKLFTSDFGAVVFSLERIGL